MHHLRQPYVHLASFLDEALQLLGVVANRTNKAGHYGCTPKQVQIGIIFLLLIVFNVMSGVSVFFSLMVYVVDWGDSLNIELARRDLELEKLVSATRDS